MDTRGIMPAELLADIAAINEVEGWDGFNEALRSIKHDLIQTRSDFANPNTALSGWQNLITGMKDMMKI